MLETEIKFFRKNQEDWIKKYPGKFVLVKGEQLIGVYPNESILKNPEFHLTPL